VVEFELFTGIAKGLEPADNEEFPKMKYMLIHQDLREYAKVL
jgi:hypothetical protein